MSETKHDSSSCSGVHIILFIIAIICYFNIDDGMAEDCHVIFHKEFLKDTWILNISTFGFLMLSLCFFACLEDTIVILIGHGINIISVICFWTFLGILWNHDENVYRLRLHNCTHISPTPTIVTAIQVIPMIYTILTFITMTVLGLFLFFTICIYGCGFCYKKKRELDHPNIDISSF